MRPSITGMVIGGRDEGGEDVIGSVPGRTVLVPVSEPGRQDVVDDVEEVGVAAGSGFDQRNTGGGVGAEDLDDPVTLAGDEAGHLGSDVDRLRLGSGPEMQYLAVHG